MRKPLLTFICVICCVWVASLCVQAQNFRNQSDLQWIAVPDDNDWTYQTGKDARIGLQLLWHGMPLGDVEVSYAIGDDCLDADTRGFVKTDSHLPFSSAALSSGLSDASRVGNDAVLFQMKSMRPSGSL